MVLQGGDRAPLPLTRLATPVVVDGSPTDAAWDAVPPLPLTNLYPTFESPITERTEIRVAYDERYLYASIRAYDTEPHRVLATTLYRDRWVSDDEFVVILDTFSDGQNGAMFLVTPAGVRVDNQLTNDAVPGRGPWMNRDWNVVWDAAARMTDEGWFAEMRIPFASLNFRDVDGEVRMRLKTYRYIRRKGENQMFPPTRPEDGAAPHFQPSLGAPIVLHSVRASRPLLVSPFATVRAASERSASSSRLDVGLDARWMPAPGAAVDATVNTDFAQVEVDDEQLNLTRFSLFFPEKRPFFQERAGLFSVSTGGESNVFYSRRIGLDDQGRPVPLLAGVRVGARVAGWDLGVLNAWTGSADRDGTQHLGVARAQRAIGASTLVGAMATHRVAAGANNVTWAVDGTSRLGRTGRATWAWAQSADRVRGTGREAGRVFLRLQRDVERGLAGSAEYRWAGRDYAPGLGFVPTEDFHEAILTARQRWRDVRWRRLRSHGWSTRAAARVRRADGGFDELGARAEWSIELANNLFTGVRAQTLREDIAVPFPLFGRATVAAGRYDQAWTSLFLFTPEDRRLRGSLTAEAGSFYGGRRSTLRISPLWNQSRHFEVSADLDHTVATMSAGGRLVATVVRGRLRLAASRQLSAEFFVQRNTTRGVTSLNGRVRLNLSEGHDLWLVVDGANGQGQVTSPAGRTAAVTVKYVRLLRATGRASEPLTGHAARSPGPWLSDSASVPMRVPGDAAVCELSSIAAAREEPPRAQCRTCSE